MNNYIIKTCWMNKSRKRGLKEHYELIKKMFKERENVELLGLYRPLNDGWNWAYFLKLNDIDEWRSLDKEINEKYVDVDDNITKILTRVYVMPEDLKDPPIPKRKQFYNYISEEMMVWDGINVGFNDYYSAVYEILEDVDSIRFLGTYMPWSEYYNYTFFHMFDALSNLRDLDARIFRDHGRPENMTSHVIRLYERFEP
jgi:hypothetical protein